MRVSDLPIWKLTRSVRHGIWKKIPKSVRVRVAPKLARTRPVAWYPMWTFGASESEGSFLFMIREKLWADYYNQPIEARIVVPWIESLKVNSYLGNDISRCVYVAGNYEPNEFMFMSLMLQPGMVFVDVGANEGLYTLYASKKVGEQGHVIALEPSPREFDRLNANLKLNRIKNVRAIKAGAWHTEESGTLKIAGTGHEGLNTLGNFVSTIDQANTEKISLLTLDTLNLERVDWIKIDVEGAELSALKGANEILRHFKPILQVEVFERALKNQGTTAQELFSFLISHGYEFFRFGSRGKPEEITSNEIGKIKEANVIAIHKTKKQQVQDLISR